MLNAAARLVSGTHKYDSGLTQLLHADLHWLDVADRIRYKLGVTVVRTGVCTTESRRHSKTSYSACPVASGLLQRRAGRSSSFHTGTVPASLARSGTHRSGSQAA